VREPGLGSTMPHGTESVDAKYLLEHYRNRHPKIVPEQSETVHAKALQAQQCARTNLSWKQHLPNVRRA
jgi:hypothetical protein